MSAHSSRRIAAWVSTILLLTLVAPPLISLGRFRAILNRSISQALGQPVSVGSVTLRLLPQPGFALQNLVVSDDASFSAEPILRSDEVFAYLRLSSLWRGRLEVAKLSLHDCSINLVRRQDGRWNLYSLLERTSHASSAPTARIKPMVRLRFPYIEAENGRVNFKIGPEKKVFAFTDADFALWQASDDEWSMRLKAQPVRTDANLSDTGTFSLEGSFQRAPSLRETPVRFALRLKNGQLGQLSKLMYGKDRGWRGAVNLNAQLVGTPAALSVVSDAEVQDFRRYDIITSGFLRLAAHCSGSFSSVDQSWRNITCRAPIGDGGLTASGEVEGPISAPDYDLRVVADKVPMQAIVAAARHAKQNLPEDLSAKGELNGAVTIARAKGSAAAVWTGGGRTSDFRLTAESSGNQIVLGDIALGVSSDPDQVALRKTSKRSSSTIVPVSGVQVAFEPFDVELGGAEPARASALVTRHGYSVDVKGGAQVQRLLHVAKTLGLPAPGTPLTGSATVDLKVAGGWSGFAAPTVTGKTQLHNVTAHIKGIASPLEISSATLALDPNTAKLQNLAATFVGSGMHWTGEVGFPRGCKPTNDCLLRANLRADQVLVGELNKLLNPKLQNRPWYRLLEGSQPSALGRVHAEGLIATNRLVWGEIVAGRTTAAFSYGDRVLQVRNMRSTVWGGNYIGELTADFSGKGPQYSSTGSIEKASLSQFQESLGTGALSLNYRATLTGWTRPELMASLLSHGDFTVRDGVLSHISIGDNAKPLHMRRFSGSFRFADGKCTVDDGKLQSGPGIYDVSGTASADKSIDFRLVRDRDHVLNVTGNMDSPKVSGTSAPQTEAAMKP
jgi:hypothetical protein